MTETQLTTNPSSCATACRDQDYRYDFSTVARLFGANCLAVELTPDSAVFTSKHNQAYEYDWHAFEPHIKHYGGALFDTLVFRWNREVIRLNGIRKADVAELKKAFYYQALTALEARFMQADGVVAAVQAQGYLGYSQQKRIKAVVAEFEDWFKVLAQQGKKEKQGKLREDELRIEEKPERKRKGIQRRFERAVLEIEIPELLQPVLSRLNFWYQCGEKTFEHYNRRFVEQQKVKHQALFDHIESQPLTDNQRDACIVCNDANLVLAGAGTGKTSVMLGRCAYLLDSQQATAPQILVLAFAKDAAKEMQARLKLRLPQHRITVKTFHSLGLEIMTQVEGSRPSISKLAQSDNAKLSFIKATLSELLNDSGYRELFRQYCFAVLSWQNGNNQPHTIDEQKHPAEVEKILAGKGRYKIIVSQLAELLDQYKNHRRLGGRKGGISKRLDPLARLSEALLTPLYDAYNDELAAAQEIDFDDMIATACEYVKQGKYSSGWQHILVDEFQDISQSRADLVRQLQLQVDDSRLFCVGDDWQAIYQFAGSDIDVTTRFSDYFGDVATLSLDTTFRFNDKISAVASRFVMANPQQLTKNLLTRRREKKSCVTVLPYHEGNDEAALIKALTSIHDSKTDNPSVLILARFNFLLPKAKQKKALAEQFPDLSLQMMTVHASKGQEANVVIVLAMQDGEHGFPSEKRRHPYSECLRPDPVSFAHAEERRLFYVALSRAKDHVYLLAHEEKTSPFIKELRADNYAVTFTKRS